MNIVMDKKSMDIYSLVKAQDVRLNILIELRSVKLNNIYDGSGLAKIKLIQDALEDINNTIKYLKQASIIA